AEINELRRLRFADDQLRAVLDFLVVIGKAIRQRVARVVGPLDDVDELLPDEIQDRQSPALPDFPYTDSVTSALRQPSSRRAPPSPFPSRSAAAAARPESAYRRRRSMSASR